MGRRYGVRIELDPTPAQAERLGQMAGASRFIWNWALEEKNRHYREVVVPSRDGEGAAPVRGLGSIDLGKRWNAVRADVAPWFAGA